MVCEKEDGDDQSESQVNRPEIVMPDFPDFDLGDIPAVPSGAVQADTALTIP